MRGLLTTLLTVLAQLTLSLHLAAGASARGTTPSTTLPTYTWTYNHSSTVSPSVDISRNGSGSAYAFACQAASASYNKAFSQFITTRTASTYPTYVSSSSIISELWDIWTTDCDGIPHARGTAPTATTTIWSTSTYTNFAPSLDTSYPGVSPTCRIQPTDCGAVQSSYVKESKALAAFTTSFTAPYYVANEPLSPMCSTVCTASQICMIMGDEVRLIYWPVTTTGANSCRRHGTTVSASATAVESIVSLGTTFYSPTAYISFKSLSAWDWGCYSTIGKPVSHTIIPVDPKSLSSARGNHLGRSAVSFNLADLNGFVSSAAFFQMQPYDWYPHATIYDEGYRPIIWMPEEVLSFRPEWKHCDLSIFGIEDPPLALHTAAYLTRPGYEHTPTSKASPAPSASDWAPTATPTAEAEHTSARSSTHPSKSHKSDPASSHPPATSKSAHRAASSVPDPTSSGTPSSDCVSIGSEGVVYQSKTYTFSSVPTRVDLYTNGWYSVTTASAGDSYAMVAGSTLYVAGPEMTVAGHTVSAGSAGVVVDGSQTIAFETAPASTDGAAATQSSTLGATSAAETMGPASISPSNGDASHRHLSLVLMGLVCGSIVLFAVT